MTAVRSGLERRAVALEYGTIAWNVGEAFLTIGMGTVAGSLALIAFGTSSTIEVFASAVVVWHLKPGEGADHPGRTVRALRLVSIAFGVLAVALAAAAVRDLASGRRAGASWWGVAYLAATALVMFGLASAKRRVGRALDSKPLTAEATMTFLDGVLSTSTLVGLAANAALAVWWADPAAALVVAAFSLNEARENWQEAREAMATGGGTPPAVAG